MKHHKCLYSKCWPSCDVRCSHCGEEVARYFGITASGCGGLSSGQLQVALSRWSAFFASLSLYPFISLSLLLSLPPFLWCSLFLKHTISIHNVLVVATPMKCLCPEQIERREGEPERYRDNRTAPFSSPQGSWPSVQDGSLCVGVWK